MKSVFDKGKGKGVVASSQVPVEFQEIAKRFVEVLRATLDENEVRAMAADKVASPGLQVRKSFSGRARVVPYIQWQCLDAVGS